MSAFVCGLIVLAAVGCGDCNTGVPQSIDDTTDPGQVFQQCGAVDIIFMMDTSGSMSDEAAALCSQLGTVLSDIEGFGLTDVRVFLWGITEDGDDDSDFFCLTDNVRDVFGDPITPGTEDRRLNLGDSDEDWGPGTAIVSELFAWRQDSIRIIVPISDEGPSNGDPADEPDDAAMIANAITFAVANGVIVSPIIGTGAEPATSQHGLNLAAGTGGIAKRSTDPDLDFGQLIFDIVFQACGGTPEEPMPPVDPGPTRLVAIARNGGIYTIDPNTGVDTFLVDTPIAGLGVANLTHVSSMIYNEANDTLWAGTGGQADCEACIYQISSVGDATHWADNSDEMYALPGMAQRRSDRVIFGMNGDDDGLYSINNATGLATEFSYDVGNIDSEGNALTFVGEQLYLASGDELWTLDDFTGAAELVEVFSLIGFPPGEFTDYNILSMTTRPSDNRVFAILRDRSGEVQTFFLCWINVVDAEATFIGQLENQLDGIAWVPTNYFVE